MSPDQYEPLDAEVVDVVTPPGKPAGAGLPPSFQLPYQPPPRRTLWPILGCGGAVLLVVILMCGGAAVLLYRAGEQLAAGGNGAVAVPIASERTLVEQTADIKRHLDGQWHVAADDPNFREVRQLLRDLERAHADDNTAAFDKLVVWPAHMERYHKAYRFQPIRISQRMQLETLERGEASMPLEANNFKIADVDERTADDWFVYTYAQEGDLAHTAYLFHLRRSSGNWKLVDWAEVPELRWSAEHNGYGAGPPSTDPYRHEQQALIADLEEWESLRQADNLSTAEQTLRRAEQRNGVPQLHDSNTYLIAIRWFALGKYDEAERVIRRISDPNRFPWAHDLIANIHYRRGDHAACLAAIDRYEQGVGFHYDLAKIKVFCHQELKQQDQAATAAIALLRYAPADALALSQVMSHVPADQLPAALALLPQEDETAERLVNAVSVTLYRNRLDSLEQVRAYLLAHHPESEHLLKLDVQQLRYQGEFELALAKQRELMERSEDDEQKREVLSESLSLSMQFKTPLEVYQAAADPRAALAIMTEGTEYEEGQLSLRQLKEILPLHRQRDPDDPKIAWYTAIVAEDQGDYVTALAEYQRALAALPEDAEDYERDELRLQIFNARYQVGQGLDAYREADDPLDAYHSLAALYEQDGQWDKLKELNELHRVHADDLWIEYYRLCIAEHEALETKRADRQAEVLQRFQQLAERNAEFGNKIYPYMITAHIYRLASESPDWRKLFAESQEPAQLFHNLAARFKRAHDDAALQELVTAFRQKAPEDDALLGYDIDRMWDAKNYAGIIARLASRPQASLDKYARGRWQDRLVLCHLLLGDTTQAWQAASDPDENVRLRLFVRMAEGDLGKIREFLNEHADALYLYALVNDDMLRVPALAAFVQSDAFRQLRADYDIPLTFHSPISKAILFDDEQGKWDEESIRMRLTEGGIANAQVELLPQPPLATRTFRIRVGEHECRLTLGDEPYTTSKDLERYGQHLEPDFAAVVAKHKFWLAIEMTNTDDKVQQQTWQKIVAAFVRGHDAIWATLPEGENVYAVLSFVLAKELQAGQRTLLSLHEPDRSNSWLPQTDSAEDLENRTWYTRSRAAAQGGPLGRIQIRVQQGSATEKHWLQVMSVTHKQWGTYTITAKLEQASQLQPLLHAGDVVRISAYEILQWEN